MPFKTQTFMENVEQRAKGLTREKLAQICQSYALLTTQQQKAHSIREMMDVLDREVDEGTRYTLMEECGRRCIGRNVLEKARSLKKEAADLDDLLSQLNQVPMGGGHLQRDGNVIHAIYDRCYCRSVNKTREPLSLTFCHCSCGWFTQLFEYVLDQPVEVELLTSVVHGDERCQFVIRIPKYAWGL